MLFEQDYIIFELLDVLEFAYSGNHKIYNSNRNYDAVSFRISSDAILETATSKTALSDGFINYVPSDVNYTRSASDDHMIVVHLKFFNYHAEDVESFLPEHPEKYQTHFRELLKLWNKKDTTYKNECAAILYKIFAECQKDNPSTAEGGKISASVSYLQKNYLQKDFSLSLAAQKSYVSEPYFRKLFKKEFGMSPKQYVINGRIRHAAALILANYYSLQEVSDLCGYRDYKHFSVEFKRMMGVSPSAYTYNYLQDEKNDLPKVRL